MMCPTCHYEAVHDGSHVRVVGVQPPAPHLPAQLSSQLLQILRRGELSFHLLHHCLETLAVLLDGIDRLGQSNQFG